MSRTHVLITHHKSELEPYLNNAINSVLWQTAKPKLTVISSSPISNQIDGVEYIVDETLNSPTKKVDHFLDRCTSEFTMIMSNDVVLGDNVIQVMEESNNGNAIMSAISNNEHGSRYFTGQKYTTQDYDLDDVDLEEVKTYNPAHSILFTLPWVSFYAPFIPMNIWNKVGRLDPALDKSHNDVDFCMRARKLGFPTLIHGNCFALHYGSKTTPSYMSEQDRIACMGHFVQKWSQAEIANLLL